MKTSEAKKILALAREANINASWATGNKYVSLQEWKRVKSLEEAETFIAMLKAKGAGNEL
jgi:hypothetical protein